MTDPTSIADFDACLAHLLADTTLSHDARATAISLLHAQVGRIPWRSRAAGDALTARIASHLAVGHDLDAGMRELARAGRLKATIHERGNGLPDVGGGYAVDGGGGLWRVVEIVGGIHIGAGESSIRAMVVSAEWADLDDDDDPQCGCVTEFDNDPTE
jgi:hypothetical protein